MLLLRFVLTWPVLFVVLRSLMFFYSDGNVLGFTVSAIDDNIYSWCVKISTVNDEDLLAVDLTVLYDNYG